MQKLTLSEDLPKAFQLHTIEMRSISILTGAGVSAESGIPTFRDARTGEWAQHDPMDLASMEGFARDPARVWGWYQWRRELISANRPNAGHEALAVMQNCFDVFTLVTQNVDGFHQLAGSRDVIELHGNIHRNVCSKTGKVIEPEWIAEHGDETPPPSPHHAEGLARPDVVWFGEMLDERALTAAFRAASTCELMIVAGTSGQVEPAASLPRIAAESGAVVVEINPEPTALSRSADWFLEGTSAGWLPRIAEIVWTPS